MKIYVAGNCQASVLLDLIGDATGLPTEYLDSDRKKPLEEQRLIFAQPQCRAWLKEDAIFFPRIVMPGFHPDTLLGRETDGVVSPLKSYCSSIVLKAWCESIPPKATVSLFNLDVFERLGFFEFFEAGKAQLLVEGEQAGFPLDEYFVRWLADGCFMHTINHPKVRVMADIAEALVAKAGLEARPISDPVDLREKGCGWPVYPGLAERLGVPGDYQFRTHFRDGGRVLDLDEFVERSFEMFAKRKVARAPATERIKGPRYANLRSLLPAQLRGRHPYVGLPDYQYWRQAVRGDVDPVTSSFIITPEMRVSTAGSCFAQHISAALKSNGFNYFVSETDPGVGGNNFGVFSARYGNIYTTRQLLQLFDRAYRTFRPRAVFWRRGKRVIDPFRPEIEPNGFESVTAMLESRKTHFEAVRRMFEELDVFVFTLGLTETWRAKGDGAVFPVAPGVSGGVFDPELAEFVNFGVSEIVQDLKDFLSRLSEVNRRARVILTVSPVPLIATFEPRHVLSSTTYSKSVLRVAAEEVSRSSPNVTYFPSYEIITGNFNRGRYFEPDLRGVTQAGVDHVMRMFFRHFTPDATIAASVREALDIVCEEESLDRPTRAPAPAPEIPASRPTQSQPERARAGFISSAWRRLKTGTLQRGVGG